MTRVCHTFYLVIYLVIYLVFNLVKPALAKNAALPPLQWTIGFALIASLSTKGVATIFKASHLVQKNDTDFGAIKSRRGFSYALHFLLRASLSG